MFNEITLGPVNGDYVMPPDAGPAWRAAAALGVDMSRLEANLRASPMERLLANSRAAELKRQQEQSRPILGKIEADALLRAQQAVKRSNDLLVIASLKAIREITERPNKLI